MRILIYLTGLVACIAATASLADTTLIYETSEATLQVRVAPGVVRIDDAGPRWQLYRQSENTIYSINPEKNTYVRMDADSAKTIRRQVEKLRKRMQERLSKLPPKQRKIARAALLKQLPILDAKRQETSIHETGKTGQVADRKCRILVIQQGDQAAGSLCLAKRTSLGMSAPEFASVKAMFELMKSMLAGTGLGYVSLPHAELDGMPIRYTGESGTVSRTLTKINHQDLPGMIFKIPPSYEELRPQLND